MQKVKKMFNGLNILLTGGTGSFGKQFIKTVLNKYHPRRLIIFSRDELKQHEMRTGDFNHRCLRYFIGDVRDLDRLKRAMHGVEIVIHAAALKQIHSCEYNPFEAVKTNVYGAQNIIDAAIDTGVKKVLTISTDKAVHPINLYGATKLCSEKLFVQGNAYSVKGGPIFSCSRYGNVIGSRGSVVPLFKQQQLTGKLTVTDKRMTRFWLTLEQGVHFVIRCIEMMKGGEIFVPKLPSMKIIDLANSTAPGCEIEFTGIQHGEKLHEILISVDEARHTVELEDMYIIDTAHPWREAKVEGNPLPDGFEYKSDKNDQLLTEEQLRQMIK